MEIGKTITEFYTDKSIFLTGVTGFLGKVVLEKLLRSCEGIVKVYILMRSKKGKSVEERFNVLLESQVFSEINESLLKKVVPIEGDITKTNLGISDNDRKLLINEVNIVIHSAATVKFTEPLKKAIEVNVLPLRDVIKLCNELRSLTVGCIDVVNCLCYVSTAFSQCILTEFQSIEEKIYETSVNYLKFIEDALVYPEEEMYSYAEEKVGKFPNSYCLTKSIAEYLLNEEASGLPLAIVRPSIVAPALNEPFPGWTDTFYGISGVTAAIGSGMMRIAYAKKCHHDIVPVDYVSNYILCVVWYASVHRPPFPFVCNCTSSGSNPTSITQLVKDACASFKKYPVKNQFRQPHCETTDNSVVYNFRKVFQHLVPAAIVDSFSPILGIKLKMLHKYKIIHKSINVIKFVTTREWKWTDDNQYVISKVMTEEERQIFNFDMKSINWSEFIEIIAKGIATYLLIDKTKTEKSGPLSTDDQKVDANSSGPLSTADQKVDANSSGPRSTDDQKVDANSSGPLSTADQKVDANSSGPFSTDDQKVDANSSGTLLIKM